jgi:hypothetical protein
MISLCVLPPKAKDRWLAMGYPITRPVKPATDRATPSFIFLLGSPPPHCHPASLVGLRLLRWQGTPTSSMIGSEESIRQPLNPNSVTAAIAWIWLSDKKKSKKEGVTGSVARVRLSNWQCHLPRNNMSDQMPSCNPQQYWGVFTFCETYLYLLKKGFDISVSIWIWLRMTIQIWVSSIRQFEYNFLAVGATRIWHKTKRVCDRYFSPPTVHSGTRFQQATSFSQIHSSFISP